MTSVTWTSQVPDDPPRVLPTSCSAAERGAASAGTRQYLRSRPHKPSRSPASADADADGPVGGPPGRAWGCEGRGRSRRWQGHSEDWRALVLPRPAHSPVGASEGHSLCGWNRVGVMRPSSPIERGSGSRASRSSGFWLPPAVSAVFTGSCSGTWVRPARVA